MIAWLSVALAQQYAMPTSAADYPHFYPTAYFDQGGTTDWNCASLTYSGHRGTDLGGGSWTGMDEGRDIAAAAPGVVSATNDGEYDRCYTGDCYGGGGFGNYVYIQHADGNETIYAHMKQWSVQVAVGDEVACGDKLGEMGSSGYSTGPHLHFQVNDLAGSATDPFDGACDPGAAHWVDQGVWDGLPGQTCDVWPGCQPTATVTCGEVIDARNDDPGSVSANAFWGCTDFALYTGPELVWTFQTDLDEPVTIDLTNLSADLDLFVIDDFACDGRSCNVGSTSSATSDEQVVFDAVANQTYALVVDGWDGAVTDFHLEIACNGDLPGTGTTSGTGTGSTTPGTVPGTATGTGTGTVDTGPSSDPGVVDDDYSKLGCGCSQGPGPATAWLLLVPLLGFRRR